MRLWPPGIMLLPSWNHTCKRQTRTAMRQAHEHMHMISSRSSQQFRHRLPDKGMHACCPCVRWLSACSRYMLPRLHMSAQHNQLPHVRWLMCSESAATTPTAAHLDSIPLICQPITRPHRVLHQIVGDGAHEASRRLR
jgi:hypothetical protein